MPAMMSATWVPWPLSSIAASDVPVKSDRALDLALQVGMRGVVAGVEHGHGGPGAVVPLGPGLGRVDLRHAVLERGANPAVQPDLAGAREVRVAGGEVRLVTAQRLPDVADLVLRALDRDHADRVEVLHLVGRVGRRRGTPGLHAPAPLQQQRDLVGGVVVEPAADQQRDVEQALVERPRLHVRQRLGGYDVHLAVLLVDQGRREPLTAGTTTDAPCLPFGACCQATTSPVSSVTRASDAAASPAGRGCRGASPRSGSAAVSSWPRPPSGRPRVTTRTSASSRDRTDRAERGVGISES